MLADAIGDLLPSAVAVALSPIPIIGVVLVLGTPRARGAGVAFAAGWVVGLAAVGVLVVFVLGNNVDDGTETGIGWVEVAIGVAFLVMARGQWKKRPRDGEAAELPGWLRTVDSLTPLRAAGLGFALSAVNPKNFALTLAAGASIAEAGLDGGDETLAILAYVAIGSVTVAGSVLFYLVDAERAARPLDAIRRFMTEYNAVIMMVILLLLGAKLIGDGLGGI